MKNNRETEIEIHPECSSLINDFLSQAILNPSTRESKISSYQQGQKSRDDIDRI